MKKKVITILFVFAMIVSATPLMNKAVVYATTNGHSQADAVAWANQRYYENWGRDMDGNGLWCVDLIHAYRDYLGVPRCPGHAYTYQNADHIPAGWSKSSSPQPGDVVVFGQYGKYNKAGYKTGEFGHIGIVTEVNGSEFVYISTAQNQTAYPEACYTSYAACFVHPDFPSGPVNHAPEGCFRVSVGGEGYVFVRGWAYDPDDMSNQIAVDVYIGAPLGDVNAEGHRIRANKQDPEGHNSGTNHGFSENIVTSKRGHVPVYCYAVDTTMTSNVLLSDTCLWVDVTSDSTAPTVSDVKITDQDSEGYTVSCKVTDAGTGVNRVQFPTWTLNNGQDDLAANWQTSNAVKGTKNGDVYIFRVKRSEHNNEYGNYVTDIYAWDNAGNCTGNASRQGVTLTAPHNHTLVKTSAKAATTSAPGNIEYWTCSGCGKCFKDSAGKTEISKADTVIPKQAPAKAKTTVKTDLPSVTITSVKTAKKAATVKWKKVSKKNQKKIVKIQIQYSTDKKFKKGVKTVSATKSATAKKITKLKSKKQYYFRLRSYKKAGNVTHVSKWSKVRRVKIK